MITTMTSERGEHRVGHELAPADQCHQSERASRDPHRGDGDDRDPGKDGDHPRRGGQQATGPDMAERADANGHRSGHEAARKPQADPGAQITHPAILTDPGPSLRRWTRRILVL